MKEWWQSFFVPVMGEVMFGPRAKQSEDEVAQILKQVKLSPESKILDLACGVGRHSIRFAKRKFEVVGLDFTKNFLLEAKKSARIEKVKVDFVQGDMKNLKPHFENAQFDMVVSLFNSFGYFNRRSDDKKMLNEVFRVLKPGGRLVINTLNGDGVKKTMSKPTSQGREPVKNVFMIDARKRKIEIHRSSFQQNVYTYAEMKSLLLNSGFKIEKTWALLHGGKFDPKTSWHQTIVAKKPI